MPSCRRPAAASRSRPPASPTPCGRPRPRWGSAPGGAFSLAGTGFLGVAEAGAGGTQSSASDYPLVILRRLDNEATVAAAASSWTAPPAPAPPPAPTTASAGVPRDTLPGPHLAWVVVNGVLGGGWPLVVAPLPSGDPCVGPMECASSYCVDGYCCDAACAGECNACDAAGRGWSGGQNGTCAVAPAGFGGDPPCAATFACNGTSATCPAWPCADDLDCSPDRYCEPNGACVLRKDLGAACGAADCKLAPCRECQSGACVEGYCCDSACDGGCNTCAQSAGASANGTCTTLPVGSAGNPSCSPFVCDGAAASCPTTCTVDTQCVVGYFCAADGSCVAQYSLAHACARAGECASGACADGVCCDTACDGPCTYCKLGAFTGTCQPVPDGADPRHECQASSGGSAPCAGKCQVGQCSFPDVGTSCGRCSGCDGTGRCTETPADDDACGTIACDGLDTACRSYRPRTTNRCAALGACKPANDPATCTEHVELACTDGGDPTGDAGAAGSDGGADAGGGNGGGSGCGCTASRAPGTAALAALLALGLRLRRRPRG